VGRRYGLEIDNPVGGDGRFVSSTPLFAGERVFEANEHVIAVLREAGNLLKAQTQRHSYPHCWRHKTPVIFRATPQWFISMDKAGLRRDALSEIAKVKWVPAWGEQRIGNMVANRPDWCISRQRTWGVPIPLFVHRQTGELHPRMAELIEKIAQRVQEGGIDAWFDMPAEAMLGADAVHYDKSADVMDVWMDSGVLHYCVAKMRPAEVLRPADVYLEGSDQHRGWFHSSLLTSVAMDRRAPYREVVTHGFTVDDRGRKMSKSLGNVIAPQKIVGTLGADVLRLWVASIDYSNEIVVTDEVFKRTADAYRRMRNTLRYLLGNLHGFDPERDAVVPSDMVALDRWVLAAAAALQEDVIAAYRRYDLHEIYQKVHNFCVLQLGGFYLDIIKDRMYTTGTKSLPRRSGQTAAYHIAHAMVRWLAPLVSFTAEEVWRYLPGAAAESVFLQTWHRFPERATERDAIDWDRFVALKSEVARELETLRTSGRIGAPLEAEVRVTAGPAEASTLRALGDELRFLLITSRATIADGRQPPAGARAAPSAGESVWIDVRPLQAPKCVRCWHLRDDVGSNAAHPELCARCVLNIEGPGEERKFV
jgi:isoleucyl-tRNA synthetase